MTSLSEKRDPAVAAAGGIQKPRIFLLIENRDLRQHCWPIAPKKKRIPLSAELRAIFDEMASRGGRDGR